MDEAEKIQKTQSGHNILASSLHMLVSLRNKFDKHLITKNLFKPNLIKCDVIKLFTRTVKMIETEARQKGVNIECSCKGI